MCHNVLQCPTLNAFADELLYSILDVPSVPSSKQLIMYAEKIIVERNEVVL